jgi:hypothetical protein
MSENYVPCKVFCYDDGARNPGTGPGQAEGTPVPLTSTHIQAPVKAPDGTSYYKVRMSGAQIYALATLARWPRCAPAVPKEMPRSDRQLREDLSEALEEIVNLTPEPSDDAYAYLEAIRAGTLPDWDAGDRPLTSRPIEIADAIGARLARKAG